MGVDIEHLYQLLVEKLTQIANQACKELATAWAEAIQETAPRKTGLLADSAHADEAAVVLQHYWKYVAYGHRIYSPKTRGLVVQGMDAMGNATFKKTRPNPFMEKAWDSPKVQAVLHKYAGSYIHIPYPLNKVPSSDE